MQGERVTADKGGRQQLWHRWCTRVVARRRRRSWAAAAAAAAGRGVRGGGGPVTDPPSTSRERVGSGLGSCRAFLTGRRRDSRRGRCHVHIRKERRDRRRWGVHSRCNCHNYQEGCRERRRSNRADTRGEVNGGRGERYRSYHRCPPHRHRRPLPHCHRRRHRHHHRHCRAAKRHLLWPMGAATVTRALAAHTSGSRHGRQRRGQWWRRPAGRAGQAAAASSPARPARRWRPRAL